jgi:hypothetical protein
MKIVLAHGVLGPLDEMVMNSAPELIFVVTMLLGWLRIRKMRDDEVSRGDDQPSVSAEVDEKN